MSALVAVVGPTAAGKSAVAMELARRLGGEIISVDSMQVYRGMDIGTAKPSILERRQVVHHLVDIVEPEVDFTVAEFSDLGRKVILASTVPLIIAGGSGLHFRSLVDPMSFAPTEPHLRAELEEAELDELVAELELADPAAASHVDIRNKRRVVRAVEVMRLGGGTPSARAGTVEADRLRRYDPDFPIRVFGLDAGALTEGLIDARLGRMRAGGLVDEVRRLAPRLGRTAAAAVGYREIVDAIEGRSSFEDAFVEIAMNTRRLARRQRTWFQRDPRVKWIPWSEDPASICDRIQGELE